MDIDSVDKLVAKMPHAFRIPCPICTGPAIYTRSDGVVECKADRIVQTLGPHTFKDFGPSAGHRWKLEAAESHSWYPMMFGRSAYAEAQLEKRQSCIDEEPSYSRAAFEHDRFNSAK